MSATVASLKIGVVNCACVLEFARSFYSRARVPATTREIVASTGLCHESVNVALRRLVQLGAIRKEAGFHSGRAYVPVGDPFEWDSIPSFPPDPPPFGVTPTRTYKRGNLLYMEFP